MKTELPKVEKKKLSRELDRVFNNNLVVDDSSDEEFLKKNNYTWDELNTLKEDLAKSVFEFITQVTTIITNSQVMNNLGDKKDHFNKLVNLFFSDINTFSNKVAKLREEHEHLNGAITTLEDFDKYNRIAIHYQALFSELATLITPTLSEIVLTIAEISKSNQSAPIKVEATEVKEERNGE